MEALELGGEILIRPYEPEDQALIFSSWLQSYWDGLVRYLLPVAKTTYYGEQHRLIDRAFHRPGTVTVIAASSAEPHVIIGWLMAERTPKAEILHYVYVKEPFRRLGIARTMLSAVGKGLATLQYTHTTKRWQQIMQRYPDAVFNPWLLGK